MNTSVQTTICLRGIDTAKILDEFLKGDLDHLDLPNTKVTFAKTYSKHVQELGVGKGPTDAMYEKSINSVQYRVYTTNCDLYHTYHVAVLDGTVKSTNETLAATETHQLCDHCRQPTTGNLLVVPRVIRKSGKKTLIYGEMIACHYVCALAIIRSEARLDPHNFIWKEAERILKSIWHEIYGAVPLNPAPHWKYLVANGGSMPADEFYSGEHEYKNSCNYVFLPIKAQCESKITI